MLGGAAKRACLPSAIRAPGAPQAVPQADLDHLDLRSCRPAPVRVRLKVGSPTAAPGFPTGAASTSSPSSSRARRAPRACARRAPGRPGPSGGCVRRPSGRAAPAPCPGLPFGRVMSISPPDASRCASSNSSSGRVIGANGRPMRSKRALSSSCGGREALAQDRQQRAAGPDAIVVGRQPGSAAGRRPNSRQRIAHWRVADGRGRSARRPR